MSRQPTEKKLIGLLKWIVPAAIGITLAMMLSCSRGFAWRLDAAGWRGLSDGFFVVGFVILGLGILTLISTTGFFDIFSYAFKSLLTLFTAIRDPKDQKKYLDYKAEKEEHRKQPTCILLIIGGVMVVFAVICLMMYYR